MGRATRVAVAVVALTACGAVPRHRAPAVALGVTMPGDCQQANGVSYSDATFERCVGWALDRVLMLSTYRPYDNAELTAYVTAVGARLLAATGKPIKVTFRLIDDPEAVASASLGGTIYIARGALARLRDEAELAALLGHELGHQRAGHMRESMLEQLRGVERPRAEQASDLRSARDDEIQADDLAVLFTARAGYDPHAVGRMLRAIAAGQPTTDADDPDDAHPPWAERLARVDAFADRFPASGERRESEYRAHLAGLVVGDDPRVAAVVGTVGLFALSNVAIDLPREIKATASNGTISLAWPDAGEGVLEVFPREVGMEMHDSATPPEDAWHEIVMHGAVAVVIGAKGPHAKLRAQALAAAVRDPRDEPARLHPTIVDLAAPRALWPAAPPTGKSKSKI